MSGFLTSILRRRKPSAASAEAADAPASALRSPDENRLRDRAMVETLDRAMDMGLWEHARRVARTAIRVYPRTARLTERLARLAMLDGEPRRALQLIDHAAPGGPRDTALRLLRAGCLVQLGHRDRAHIDLLNWSRRSAAPLDARVMLALLEWDGDDPHAASQILIRNLRRTEDPRTIELLALIAVAQSRTARARDWADRLASASAFGAGTPYSRVLLCSLQLPPAHQHVRPTPKQIDRLARELIAMEDVIPALVEAQRIRPDIEVAELLEQSLSHALPDLSRPGQTLEALTRLAMIRGDHVAARRWAERGLAINPLSAPLSILYRTLADEEPPAEVTPAPDVLATIGHDDNDATPRGKAA